MGLALQEPAGRLGKQEGEKAFCVAQVGGEGSAKKALAEEIKK